jgi:ATP-dependent protease ClpP protease subunit
MDPPLRVTRWVVRSSRPMTGITIRAAARKGSAEVTIYDPIGQDWIGNGVTAKKFREELLALGELDEIVVRINSPGGEVFDGFAIYNALKDNPARVVVHVDGLAASIASVIAMAGDEVIMGRGATLMIHNPWTLAIGDADDMRKVAEQLDKVGKGLVDAYMSRAKVSRQRVISWMDDETWFTAEEAVGAGFADTMAEDDAEQIKVAARFAAKFKVPMRIAAMLKTEPSKPVDAAAVLAAETQRRGAVRARFAGRFAEDYRGLLDECLDDPRCTPEAASDKLLAKLGEGAEPLSYTAPPRAPADFVAAAADALLIRAGIVVERPHAAMSDIGRMSVLDMCRASLSHAGKSHRDLDGSRLIKAALSTSDFPGILENSIGKALRSGYEADPQSHKAWVRFTMVPDFKTVSRLLLGSAPALESVVEGGEYKYGGLDENKTSLAITKYGKAIRLTWETLINDDLGAFMRTPAAMGQAARRLEADKVYEIFTADTGNGQLMQDGVRLFHSSHGNVSATVGAISTATLGAGRALLRKQQAIGNGGYLNLVPRFLIVPAESETLAEQILAAATRHVSGTESTSARRVDSPTPEWISKLQLVVEPRLNPTYGFYLAAASDQIDTVELASLEADGGAPYLEEERGFEVDSQDYKVRHTFTAKAIDWRGLVRVPAS